MRRLLVLIFLFFIIITSVKAQETDSVISKKPWFLTFNIDVKVKSLAGNFKDYYQGEYYERTSPSGLESSWKWVTKTEERKKTFIPDFKFYDIKLDMLLGRSKGLRFGMSYNFGLLEGVDTASTYYRTINYSFLAISGIAEYQYNFFKDKDLTPFAFGSLAFGAYRGNSSIEGQGMELFGQGRLGAGFAAPGGWMGRIWTSADVLGYREKSFSPVFKKDQTVKTDINLFYFGVGFTKQFMLIPD